MITTYNQAKRLKELGFDRECNAFYSFDKETLKEDVLNSPTSKYADWNMLDHLNKIIGYASAPSISDALQWIRDKYQGKGLYFSVRHGRDRKPYYYGELEDLLHNKGIMTKACETYPNAESLLLEDVLTYLEQKR